MISAILFATALCSVLLSEGATLPSSRSLKQFAVQPTFPFCRCTDYESTSNPYSLSMTYNEVLISNFAGHSDFCFTFKYKGPKANSSACYQDLATRLYKVQFEIQPACPAAVDVYGPNVTINGELIESASLSTYAAGSLLKITNLPFTSSNVASYKLCMRVAYPCSTPENLFSQIPIKYDVEESGAHRCCSVSYLDV
ncbi:hypothetical protein CEUSTIGMA_g12949.t1 [Chlamydomonas eustigma]|uniref:Pherophorin domain-containing protein n=1 Tax=Chlamydomonas eustigma TaxID=1157962 RepID=A0A250XR88_9CHLO|nr:hypothetical protein CEUSTIGMA_g12949.t1 [Chlamydomonas eustigma]|eukprot:GAX85533.1 hypothetical protein CEUSTIGMA_g12949.t1 [Chlamydomonas eustigma]